MKNSVKVIILVALILVATIIYLMLGSPIEATIAMSMLVGVPATSLNSENLSPSLNKEDISESVTQMMPSRTPLDTILRNIKRSVPAQAQKIGYYHASYKPIEDMLNSSVRGNGLTESTPASSFIASSGNETTSIYIKVYNADMWRNNDTLLMRNLVLPGSKGDSQIGAAGSYKEDVMFYVEKKSGDILKLAAVGGVTGVKGGQNALKYIIPTFTADTKLIRMGQAKSELSISTDPFAIYPSLSHQYCQNFMAQIEESTFQRLTQKEANWGFSNFEAVNILSMKMEMELSMLFGQQGEYTQGNDRTFFTRGITRDIDNILEYGSGSTDRTLTKDQYTSWIKQVFDGNNGSTDRVLFAGSGLIKSLSLVDEFQKNMLSVEKDAVLGVDVRKIHTYFGTLNIVFAPLFRSAGWEDNGLILDLEHVTKHEFIPMSVTDLDLKSSGQKNADARVIQEVSCLTLRYPDCHAIIRPKA